jgi:peptide/nickel transport system permease protein
MRLLLGRLIGLVIILWLVIIGVFLMIQVIPGNPVTAATGVNTSPATIHLLEHQYGFDRPLFQQFTTYVAHLFHGNLGMSFVNQQPVSKVIGQRIGSSLALTAAAFVLVLGVGITLGTAAAALTRDGRHPRLEVLFTGLTSVFGAIPDFLSATILAFVFAVELRLLPVAAAGGLKGLILPAVAVSLAPAMTLSRIVRVETLNVLAQDYIRTARSSRLPARVIYGRHVLPNALTAALTIGGLLITGIIGGAVIVEVVFARPGLGSALVQAVTDKDYPTIQGIVLVLAFTVVVVNTLIDLLLSALDPRSLTRQS